MSTLYILFFEFMICFDVVGEKCPSPKKKLLKKLTFHVCVNTLNLVELLLKCARGVSGKIWVLGPICAYSFEVGASWDPPWPH